MGSSITSVTGIVSAGQSGSVTGSKEDDLKLQFAQVMSQMTTQVGTGSYSGNQNGYESRLTRLADFSKTDGYEQFQYKDNAIKKQSDCIDSAKISRSKDRMDTYESDVKEILKEELGVTDEQITTAMEQLGMTAVDLMDNKQLAGLIMELTGCEDMGQLLCKEEFLTVLNEVNTLTDAMLTELGVTAEELQQMCQSQTEPEMVTGDMAVTEPVAAETQVADETQSGAVKTASEGETVVEVSKDTTEKMSELERVTTQTEDDDTKAADSEKTVDEVTTEESVTEQVTEKETNQRGQQSQSNLNQQGNHAAQASGVVVSDNTQQIGAQQMEAVPEFARQLDTENIIKQIVEYTKVHVSNTQSTMEMQLNPENLGKIYIEVTAKEGNVSAHITAQNEYVKEALEAQIVELKQNMNQAGVKVDAVEVTVGSHEFERNLEQNAKQEEEQAREQEKSSGKMRRLNLSDLDELAGVMSEEETLVAQMMADHGNSIDYTA